MIKPLESEKKKNQTIILGSMFIQLGVESILQQFQLGIKDALDTHANYAIRIEW